VEDYIMCYLVRDHARKRVTRAREEIISREPDRVSTSTPDPVLSKVLAKLGIGKHREVKKRHLQEA
jgi:hypothetical protein